MSEASGVREFLGWVVEGFHPDTINAARARSYTTMSVWDEGVWMDRHKREACVGEPFMILSAAQEAADIARRDGWKRVRVTNCLRVRIADASE